MDNLYKVKYLKYKKKYFNLKLMKGGSVKKKSIKKKSVKKNNVKKRKNGKKIENIYNSKRKECYFLTPTLKKA